MKLGFKACIVVACVCIIAQLVVSISQSNKLKLTQRELSLSQNDLTQTQLLLDETSDDLKDALDDVTFWTGQANYYEQQANLNQFGSLSELKAWLASDNTDSHTYIPTTFDCDDFALLLIERAKADGYQMYLQTLYYDLYDGLWLSFKYYNYKISGYYGFDAYHAMNSVIIGNSVYFIEPQTDEVFFVCYVD